MTAIVEPVLPRMLPRLNDVNRAFWTGGAGGELLIQWCGQCHRWNHPPAATCGQCGGGLEVRAASGRGRVFAFTVNAHQFHPDVPPPNLIAIVELVEQADLRLPTSILHCEPSELRCGLEVQVLFEHHGDVYYPVFEPA
jgi:uncharacterized OB-fold protein